MNLKELVGLVYGVFMGTSTIYVKAVRNFEFPIKSQKLGPYELIIGGKRNQIIGKKITVDSATQDENKVALSTQHPMYFPDSAIARSETIELDSNVSVEKINPHLQVVLLTDERLLILGDLFYNRVHPPLKELKLPDVPVLREILEGLSEKYDPSLFLPAEGEPADSFEEFLSYLKDLSDKTQDFETLRSRYSHFKEIVGLSSFSENFDYLRR